jgi:hypothetical protein
LPTLASAHSRELQKAPPLGLSKIASLTPPVLDLTGAILSILPARDKKNADKGKVKTGELRLVAAKRLVAKASR